MRCAVALALIATPDGFCGSAQAQEAAPACPSIGEPHRWLDDVSCLGPDTLPKRIVRGQVELSLGGEVRARVEASDAIDFGITRDDGETATLWRGLVHADVKAGEHLRGFVQFGFTESAGRADGPGPTDESGLDLQQGFIDVSVPMGGGEVTARAGRQELAFGSARLVGVREGPNLRLAFDGVRGFWTNGAARVDAFATRPVDPRTDTFDDRSDDRRALYGVYFASARPEQTGFDLYYLGYENDAARFDQGLTSERRHSLGARVFGTRQGWSWDVEGVYQFGRFGNADIRAWTVATLFGHAWETAPLKPELTLSANAASGDSDPSDGELNTFNPLFPRLPYFNEASLGVPANFVDVKPALSLTPVEGLVVEASADFFWRESRRDAVYASPLVPLIPADASDARFIGAAYQLKGEWTLNSNVSALLALVHFDAGSVVHAGGGGDQNNLVASLAWRW